MIAKGPVEKDLKRLNRLYQGSVSGADATIPIYFSKLAVLELTGWVEESFDIIAMRAAKGRVKSTRFEEYLLKAIEDNHGFAYTKNFIPMMARIIGLPECEKLHEHLDENGSVGILDGQLGYLLDQRRKAAHVNIARTTITFDAPSVTLNRLQRIYPVLRSMYRWFC